MGIVIKRILGLVKTTSPYFDTNWITIPGVQTASAYADLDAFGTIFEIPNLPRRGIFISARMLDLDDEGAQARLVIHMFRSRFDPTADDAALAITDADVRFSWETSIDILSRDDNNVNNLFQEDGLNKMFWCPGRSFFAQAQSRGTPTIAAGSVPLIRFMGLVLEP